MMLLTFEIFLHFMARAGNQIFGLKIPTDAMPGQELPCPSYTLDQSGVILGCHMP